MGIGNEEWSSWTGDTKTNMLLLVVASYSRISLYIWCNALLATLFMPIISHRTDGNSVQAEGRM